MVGYTEDEEWVYMDRVLGQAQGRPWHEQPENQRLVKELRSILAQHTNNLLIFLGAGLSFGVDRGRQLFELYETGGGRFP